jgi:hypothetical protein
MCCHSTGNRRTESTLQNEHLSSVRLTSLQLLTTVESSQNVVSIVVRSVTVLVLKRGLSDVCEEYKDCIGTVFEPHVSRSVAPISQLNCTLAPHGVGQWPLLVVGGDLHLSERWLRAGG